MNKKHFFFQFQEVFFHFNDVLPFRKLPRASDKHVHAVDADKSHCDQARDPDQHPRVLDGVGHGKNARSDIAFDQVGQCVKSAKRNNIISFGH